MAEGEGTAEGISGGRRGLKRDATMDVAAAADYVFKELLAVAKHAPNERLPKEEQSRCCLYAFLRPQFDVVCVERGYRSIDESGRSECDLVAICGDNPEVWVELKHCRSPRIGRTSQERNFGTGRTILISFAAFR